MPTPVHSGSAPTEPRAPSPRELLQNRLVDFLSADAVRWTASYGVVPGIEPLPKGGAARSVYFGVDGVLDVCVTIFTPRDLRVVAVGDLAHLVEGRFASVDEVEGRIQCLREHLSRG